jgi:myo-inositol-1(or 4)-monophosphatase
MESHLNFATDLSYEVGELLKDHFTRPNFQSELKSDHSVVTEADLEADRLITQRVQDTYPEDRLLSEELQTTLSGSDSAVWVIDPLDGTTNFSLGLQFWGVSIARVQGASPQIAALYFPMIEELYTAERGGGVYLNGQPIQVKPPHPDQHAAFFSCCSRTHRRYHVDVPYKPRILGSATYSLCAVARGVALLAFEATPKIWDVAGSWLVVEEAGGVVELFKGDSLFPLKSDLDYNQVNFPTLSAATPQLLSQARDQIRPR